MDNLKNLKKEYFSTLKDRAKKSKVYKPHQATGLALAEILADPEHKSLYMRLSKIYDNNELLRIAKTLSEKKNIDNRGAYFMRVLHASDIRRLNNK